MCESFVILNTKNKRSLIKVIKLKFSWLLISYRMQNFEMVAVKAIKRYFKIYAFSFVQQKQILKFVLYLVKLAVDRKFQHH